MRRDGFTLVELLVAMAIAGILGWAIVAFFAGASTTANQQNYVASQTAVVQRALGLLGDDIRRSEKIVASGTSTSLTVTSGPTLPSSTGSDRLDLYIPKPDGSSCAATDVYEFRSYMAVNRSAVTALTDAWLQLPADAANESRKVLLRYQGCVTSLAVLPLTGTLRLVADYLGTFTVAHLSANGVRLEMQGQRELQGRLLSSPITPARGTYFSRRF